MDSRKTRLLKSYPDIKRTASEAILIVTVEYKRVINAKDQYGQKNTIQKRGQGQHPSRVRGSVT